MFVLLSSNAETLFKRGILEATSLPEKHPLEFRYQTKNVSEEIVASLQQGTEANLLRRRNTRALIVYAQRPDKQLQQEHYEYCPVRFATIESLRLLGDIVFVGLCLQDFPNLRNWTERPDGIELCKWLVTRDGAVNDQTFAGKFFADFDREGWDLRGSEKVDGELWQSVVDELANMPSMYDCLFYRVRGLFYPPRRSRLRSLFSKSRPLIRENRIAPRATPGFLTYPIDMSRAVDLKLLFYRPKREAPPQGYANTVKAILKVEADKSGFSEIPAQNLQLESRYDELVLRMVTKRVFDNTLAPISIRCESTKPQNMLACEPMLLCTVRVPRLLLGVLLGCFFAAPFLLAASSDDFKLLLNIAADDPDHIAARWAVYAKVSGGLVAAIAAFIAFRRLPVK